MARRDVVWPDGKKFAFTIIDDTEYSFVRNVRPVYDFLRDLGFRTTKTVWVYPPRDHYRGECLQDRDYLHFVRELWASGFEIALHNVGSGQFGREEIAAGFELFRALMGFYPTMQINHARNPDNLYWGHKRFVAPVSWLMRMSSARFAGEVEGTDHFWGDIAKEHIRYIRNFVFMHLNTLKCDPLMPYRVRGKERYSNFWFSSSDGHSVREFVQLLHPEAVDRLEEEGGCSIVYTHFGDGFADDEGNLNPVFVQRMRYVAQKEGWFVPASTILDYLLDTCEGSQFVSYVYLLRLNMLWFLHRLIKRMRFGR